jgi:hypothetical protein
MVNSEDGARSRSSQKAARWLTMGDSDTPASGKIIFDGTKLPIERSRPKTTSDRVFLLFMQIDRVKIAPLHS